MNSPAANGTKDPVISLPLEVVYLIFDFFEAQDLLLICSRINKTWSLISCDDILWKGLYFHHWYPYIQQSPYISRIETSLPVSGFFKTWKELYKIRDNVEWKYFSKKYEDPKKLEESLESSQNSELQTSLDQQDSLDDSLESSINLTEESINNEVHPLIQDSLIPGFYDTNFEGLTLDFDGEDWDADRTHYMAHVEEVEEILSETETEDNNNNNPEDSLSPSQQSLNSIHNNPFYLSSSPSNSSSLFSSFPTSLLPSKKTSKKYYRQFTKQNCTQKYVLSFPETSKEYLKWGYALGIQISEKTRKTRKFLKQSNQWNRNQDKTKFRTEILLLLIISCEEYASALCVDPRNDKFELIFMITNNWAISLAEQGRLKVGKESDKMYNLAYYWFSKTAEFKESKNDLWWILSEWAVTLRAHAGLKMSEKSYVKKIEQKKQHEKAREIQQNIIIQKENEEQKEQQKEKEKEKKEQKKEIKEKEEKEKEKEKKEKQKEKEQKQKEEEIEEIEELFRRSCEKFGKAHRMRKGDSQILSEWADGLSEYGNYMIRASSKKRISQNPKVTPIKIETSKQLFKKSYKRYSKSIKLCGNCETDKDIILSNWGLALSDHGMITEGSESEELFKQSYKKYGEAAKIKPENKLTQCNLAMTNILHSTKLKGEEKRKEELWENAEKILLKMVNVEKEEEFLWSYFCMSRLCSMRGKKEECREWLEKCKGKNYLGKHTKWFAVHFENVSKEEWFQKMCQDQKREREEEIRKEIEEKELGGFVL